MAMAMTMIINIVTITNVNNSSNNHKNFTFTPFQITQIMSQISDHSKSKSMKKDIQSRKRRLPQMRNTGRETFAPTLHQSTSSRPKSPKQEKKP